MKKLMLVVSAVVGTFAAFGDPTAKAVWNESTATLTFYYDENTYSGDGITQFDIDSANSTRTWSSIYTKMAKVVITPSFRDFQPTTLASWFQGSGTTLTSITGLEYLDTSRATSMDSLFERCRDTKLDVSRFVTTNVTSMYRMFYYVAATTLDFSSFDTSKVTNMQQFLTYGSVKTIYANEGFTMEKVTAAYSGMFCSSLVGGKGTKYSSANDDKVYARVDNPPDEPGYFTYKSATPPPTIKSVAVSDVTEASATITVVCEDLKEGSVTIELLQDGTTVASKTIPEPPLTATFGGLQPDTEYAVKVTATSAYGTTEDNSLVFKTFAPAADHWLYDAEAKTIFWGGWTFGATVVSGTETNLAVSAVTQWPASVAPLDFSLPIKDVNGNFYSITSLNPKFGHEVSFWPAGQAPQCNMVGALTLPGEGLTTVSEFAFSGCKNATGRWAMPSTLKTVGKGAFTTCGKLVIVGSSFPAKLTEIPVHCFQDLTIEGDLDLRSLKTLAYAAFMNCKVGAVLLGPNLATIGANYGRGAFQNCTALTNVQFDASSKCKAGGGFLFNGCTALEEIALTGVAEMSIGYDIADYSYFNGCSKLKKITFGPALESLTGTNVIAAASSLESVVFEGLPPKTFLPEFLRSYSSTKTVKTYVHRKLCGETNGVGVCWNDYAANGVIAAERKNPANNTTWAADYVKPGSELVYRPLMTIEPGTGLMLLVR